MGKTIGTATVTDDGLLFENGDLIVVGKMPDFSKPVAFIDFDGVLNVFPDSNRENNTEMLTATHVSLDGLGFGDDGILVRYDERVVKAIRNLNALWCTSWKAHTQNCLNPAFGIDWGYVDWHYRGLSDPGVYGKIDSLTEVVRETGCDFACIDDDFFGCGGMKDVITSNAGKEPLAVIVPDTRIGLQLEDIEKLVSLGFIA